MRAAILIAAALLAVGCDKSETKSKAAASPAANKDVLAAWKKAGLTVTSVAEADGAPFGDGDCTSVQVYGVDVVVCQYASADLAKQAEAKGLEVVGETTGVSISRGPLLLVVADRRKADPEGRAINQISQIFVGKSS
jgi:hypothetical protein